MKRFHRYKDLIWIYLAVFALFLSIPLLGNHAINAFSGNMSVRNTVIIDAGHGGVDCGAVSCSGVYESHINLEIALRLQDLMHLLGIKTLMIRTADESIHTEGATIAAKKVSDIRNRVQIANTTANALYLSIHQNHFSDERYWGSQVFYNTCDGSKEFAEMLQQQLRTTLNSNNRRLHKKSSGVYLMDHINCTGVLIECGFLSNPKEEALLRSTEYQQKLCAAIATTTAQYLNT